MVCASRAIGLWFGPDKEKLRFNLPLYWLSNQFSLVGWNTGSALVTVGLVSYQQSSRYSLEADIAQTWQQSFVSACIGSFLAAVVVVLMARPGVKYHIGLCVLSFPDLPFVLR